MPFLSPNAIGTSARALFKTGSSETLAFLTLKAEGISTQDSVRITSSETAVIDGFVLLAGQPDGFEVLVEQNIEHFAQRNNKGIPTRPDSRGSAEGYGYFFPITDETQHILRKSASPRSYLYTNLTRERKTSAKNGDKASLDDILLIEKEEGKGALFTLKRDYVYKAMWYYGPAAGKTLTIPLQHFAIWLHRFDDLEDDVTIEELVDKTLERMHITKAERELLFSDVQVALTDADLVPAFDIQAYFRAICLPSNEAELPEVDPVARHADLTAEKWHFISAVLGYDDEPAISIEETASNLINRGERSILLLGPPRTGKSRAARSIAAQFLGIAESDLATDDRFLHLQFHQGWSYGNFIRKVAPVVQGGSVVFDSKDGVFLRHCELFADTRATVVIDELNRANIAEVFGEAFQSIETDYRGIPIRISVERTRSDQSSVLVIPKEMLLLFTANDLDKSTSAIDFALLERLSTIRCAVNYPELKRLLTAAGWPEKAATDLAITLHDIEKLSGFPVGHANFYGLKPSDDIEIWYKTKLRPVVAQYLSSYRSADMQRVDSLMYEWISHIR